MIKIMFGFCATPSEAGIRKPRRAAHVRIGFCKVERSRRVVERIVIQVKGYESELGNSNFQKSVCSTLQATDVRDRSLA